MPWPSIQPTYFGQTAPDQFSLAGFNQMVQPQAQGAGYMPASPTSMAVPPVVTPAMQGITLSNGTYGPNLPGAAGATGAVGAAAGAAGSGPGAVDLGWNVGTGQLALGGLQSLGSLYGAWQASEMAKKTFAFNKEIANTNLNNQIRSYNTSLEDRARSRAAFEAGTTGFDPAAYVEQNRARRG